MYFYINCFWRGGRHWYEAGSFVPRIMEGDIFDIVEMEVCRVGSNREIQKGLDGRKQELD